MVPQNLLPLAFLRGASAINGYVAIRLQQMTNCVKTRNKPAKSGGLEGAEQDCVTLAATATQGSGTQPATAATKLVQQSEG